MVVINDSNQQELLPPTDTGSEMEMLLRLGLRAKHRPAEGQPFTTNE